MKVPDIDYHEEVKKCKTMEDVVGKNGLMQRLLKDAMQQLLEAEMDEHLGCVWNRDFTINDIKDNRQNYGWSS